MKSFSLDQQNSDVASKIVVGLELISQVFRINLWEIQKAYKISPIQTQILIFIYYHKKDLCTITQLSKEFNLTKATISDSVRVLINKGYLHKEVDTTDTRMFYLSLTDEGFNLTEKFDKFSNILHSSVSRLNKKETDILFNSLVSVINELQTSGTITERRMCSKCQFYSEVDEETYHCSLMEKTLSRLDFRLDCSEFEIKK